MRIGEWSVDEGSRRERNKKRTTAWPLRSHMHQSERGGGAGKRSCNEGRERQRALKRDGERVAQRLR